MRPPIVYEQTIAPVVQVTDCLNEHDIVRHQM